MKDEGLEGDRDFIQWDTVSLMSLLDVYVIFAYYQKATLHPKRKNKITNQEFDNQHVTSKIKEIENYHSSALHWNLKELNNNLSGIMNQVKVCYINIEKELKVRFHSEKGLNDFIKKINEDMNDFMRFSRKKAKEAQTREMLTTQPKERLQTLTKATLTITNYLGGEYFLTVDEILIKEDIIHLIESKHTKSSILPSKSDIKDGLTKMILFSNLKNVELEGNVLKHQSILQLTSAKLKGRITSQSENSEIAQFAEKNSFSASQKELLMNLFKEAKINNFIAVIQKDNQ